MTFESATFFFLAIILFAITPGPKVFALLSKALGQEAKACWAMAWGMAVSNAVYLILACYGLAAIATNWGGLFSVMHMAAAVYLIYLGYKIWHSASTLTKDSNKQGAKNQSMVFVQGFLISASNPNVILFYIAFLATFMDLTILSPKDITIAVVLCLIGLMTGLMGIAFSAS